MERRPEIKKRKRESVADDKPLPAESNDEDDTSAPSPAPSDSPEKDTVRVGDREVGASKGRLLVLVGPSGSGKTTLAKALGFTPLCTTTCRAPRPGEVDGVDYHFVSDDAFERLVSNGLMAEHASYAGVRYGVPVALVNTVRQGSVAVVGDQGEKGRSRTSAGGTQPPTFVIILNADGVDTMRRLLGRDSVLAVHVSAPLDRLEARLHARGSTHAEIDKRIRQAETTETTPAYMARCDARVVNADGHLDKTIEAVRDLCAAYFESPMADARVETAAAAHHEGDP